MIPHVLHQVWVGDPMPAHLADYCDTWRALHPTWEHKLWDEHAIAGLGLANADLYVRAAELAPGSVGQFRSDLVRYELLWRFGGVYVDTDFECRKPLDGLLDGIECFAAWEWPGRWVNNAIMGAVAGHPLLEQLIEGLPERVAALHGPRVRPNVLSGPQYLTALYQRDPRELHVFAKELFYPYLWSELDRADEAFPDAYAVHHWNNRRTNARRPGTAARTHHARSRPSAR